MTPAYYTPASFDTAAINAAISTGGAAGGGRVILPAGVYDPFPGGVRTKIVGAPNVELHGVGRDATIIRIPNKTVFQDYLIDGYACDGFRVYDMTLDMGDIDPADDNWAIGAGSGAIHFAYNGTSGGNDNAVERVKIINMGRYGIVTHAGGRGLVVKKNKLVRNSPMNGGDTGGTSNVGIMLRPDSSYPNVHAHIEENEIVNLCGIAASIFKSVVSRNVVRRSGFGTNIGIEDAPNCSGNIISENITADSTAVIPTHQPAGFEIWGQNQLAEGNRSEGNAGCGFMVCGGGGTVLQGNQSVGNSVDGFWVHPAAGPGISLLSNRAKSNGGVPLRTNGVTISNVGNDLS